MAIYKIPECNMEALEKKLATVSKKCKKYNCDFGFEILEVVIENISKKNEVPCFYKFYMVEVTGVAIINDWRFVAIIAHEEHGNIIRQYDQNIIILDSYRNCTPHCEHCNTDRYRKDTYLIYNELSQEIKQVGKSCLRDYTNGLSAEMIAAYMQYFSTCENYENCDFLSVGKKYYSTLDILNAGMEIINHVGFVSKTKAIEEEKESTLSIVMTCLYPSNRFDFERIEKVGYKGIKQDVEKVLEWLYLQNDTNDYIYNLQTIMKSDYTEYRNLGYIVSLYASYHKAKQREELKKKELSENNIKSDFFGNVGDKIVIIASIERQASYETMYGITNIYRIVSDGFLFIWKTTGYFEKSDKVTIKGSIKSHNDYHGMKQTELTRCKIS